MSPIEEILRAEINLNGAVSFHRFMTVALYCPEIGYYERARIGRHGDFYTSAAVGPLFGQLLAIRFATWFEIHFPTGAVQLVEAGAHDGTLAADILNWLCIHRPSLVDRLEYWILEPSFRREEQQRERLAPLRRPTRWIPHWQAAERRFRGAIFSNELLDAFPVHRLGWDAPRQRWFEWGVYWEGGRFRWTRTWRSADSRSWDTALQQAGFMFLEELRAILPDGFTVELSPSTGNWWTHAAQALEQGFLLTIDYGLSREELWAPHRPDGTLRAYREHRMAADPLDAPGEQDLTAHVNFAELEDAGRGAGLETIGLEHQAQFLVHSLKELQEGGSFTVFRPDEVRQFETLTHPEHLGNRFRVLVQRRP